MDLFLRTSRCRIPQQLLLHQHARRHYATALAPKPHGNGSTSHDRSPHPTAHRTQVEKKPTVASHAAPATSAIQPSKPRPQDPTKARKARMEEMVKAREEQLDSMSYDNLLKDLENVSAVEHLAAFDVWAKAIDNLDLYIPAWRNPRKNASPVAHLRAIWNTAVNGYKNAISMYRIASENGFPDVSVRRVWSPQLFKVQSTPWLAPFRKSVLETYMDLQRAVAAGDEKTVKKFTIGTHQRRLMDLIRARDPARVYVWSSDAPAQNEARVVSIRAFEQNMSREVPKFGNRLTVQALVKFDTMQKLEVYTKKGQLLQEAPPKRVVEYLIFQKRMWYDVPWVVRDQLYEGLQAKIKHL